MVRQDVESRVAAGALVLFARGGAYVEQDCSWYLAKFFLDVFGWVCHRARKPMLSSAKLLRLSWVPEGRVISKAIELFSETSTCSCGHVSSENHKVPR